MFVGENASTATYNVYYIPFVRDSQNYVNAAMIIKASTTDTLVSYACDWQYAQLQNNNNSLNGQAENFTVFFMVLDNNVFGHTKFKIIDKNIFKANNHPPREVTLATHANNAGIQVYMQLVTYCQDVTISWTDCPYIPVWGYCDDPSNPTHCDNCSYCTSSLSYTYCWDEWEDTGGGGGGGSGNGSSGDGSGGGGSGGGDGLTPPNPCGTGPQDVIQSANGNNASGITTFRAPCDGDNPGWTPIDDVNNGAEIIGDPSVLGDFYDDPTYFEDDNMPISFDITQQQWPTIASVLSIYDFVPYDHRNCLDLAKDQLAKAGVRDLGYGSAFKVYTESGGVNQTQSKDGVDYIISKLQNGKPVIVGVDNRPGTPSSLNADGSTDHFVVIVGCGSDANGNYFTFFDNATNWVTNGASLNNKLYYNSINGKISGHSDVAGANSPSPIHDYIVTQVRKNK